MLAKHMLYQLSYTPLFDEGSSPLKHPRGLFAFPFLLSQKPGPAGRLQATSILHTKKAGLVAGFLVGPGRVELPTSTLSV